MTRTKGSQTVFLPNGVELIAVPGGTQKPETHQNCFTKNGNVYTNYNFSQITDGTVDSVVDGVSYKTVGSECSTGSYIKPGNGDDGNGNGGDDGDDKDGSSVGGAALLGLSALGALGLLSSGANSSASSDESAPVAGDDSEGPATGPVAGQDAKAAAQKPATGPVGGQDPKAAAQALAANAKYVPAGQATPKAAEAPVAQQKQLANTGVEGTIVALAVGLIAAAAGAALLVLRRRA